MTESNGITFCCDSTVAIKITDYLKEYNIKHTHYLISQNYSSKDHVIEVCGNDDQHTWMILNFGKYLEHSFTYYESIVLVM